MVLVSDCDSEIPSAAIQSSGSLFFARFSAFFFGVCLLVSGIAMLSVPLILISDEGLFDFSNDNAIFILMQGICGLVVNTIALTTLTAAVYKDYSVMHCTFLSILVSLGIIFIVYLFRDASLWIEPSSMTSKGIQKTLIAIGGTVICGVFLINGLRRAVN